MVSGLAAKNLSSMSQTFVTAWRSAVKLPYGLTEINNGDLTFLAERQTCSNKMNEQAVFEMFEKMQDYWRMHLHYVYTDFCVEIHVFFNKYSYLSKEQSSALRN